MLYQHGAPSHPRGDAIGGAGLCCGVWVRCCAGFGTPALMSEPRADAAGVIVTGLRHHSGAGWDATSVNSVENDPQHFWGMRVFHTLIQESEPCAALQLRDLHPPALRTDGAAANCGLRMQDRVAGQSPQLLAPLRQDRVGPR